jgi:hypothetical protein
MTSRQALIAFIRIIAIWILIDDASSAAWRVIDAGLQYRDDLTFDGDTPVSEIWNHILREGGAWPWIEATRCLAAIALLIAPGKLLSILAGRGHRCPRCNHQIRYPDAKCTECGCEPGAGIQ